MQKQDRPSGSDAVCFTAGPRGLAFSAGVIHAWLASDRDTPQAMAGISAGALSAAALARACQLRDQAKNAPPPTHPLSAAEVESRRWAWFRQYLDAITNEPLKPIWDAIPDPDDFFADKAPVEDLSAHHLPPKLRRAEVRARQHYYRLVKLGLWLAGLNVSVAEVATCMVRWVRFKERYALWPLQGLLLLSRGLWIAVKAIVHLALSPRFSFKHVGTGNISLPRPLFGWAWPVALLVVGDAAYWLLRGAGRAAARAADLASMHPRIEALRVELLHQLRLDAIMPWISTYLLLNHWPWVATVASLAGGAALALVLFTVFFPSWVLSYLVHRLGIHRSLFDSYSLSRKLFELFSEAGEGIPVSPGLLLVAAPLQRYENEFGKQVWFEPGTRTMAEALTAATAIPGLFQAVPITSGIDGQQEPLDLIDGSLVRQNPLPALFRWLRKEDNKALAEKLFGENIDDASVHLVYSVPIREESVADASRKERIDLVESAKIGLDLARRRDSRMEFRQTNFISELA
ncbi:MAG: hypothetical protein M3N41_12350, partial [Acidobacteriota bacterium]|nr:hypothetical protein [Acidobacteriota bacterium]